MKIRELIDQHWEEIKPIIPEKKGREKPRADERAKLNAILYFLSTGCR
ncbi:MAG: transposase [Nitrososphaerales archaeon]